LSNVLKALLVFGLVVAAVNYGRDVKFRHKSERLVLTRLFDNRLDLLLRGSA